MVSVFLGDFMPISYLRSRKPNKKTSLLEGEAVGGLSLHDLTNIGVGLVSDGQFLNSGKL